MQKVGRLELTWVGKYDDKVVEPRILMEDVEKSYGDPTSANMLIHGDNLIALQALQQDFAGKIKCIYIDPPYNINAANGQYDDNIANSEWLSLMKQRLTLLDGLMADDGVILVQIDKEQSAYLKVLMDEVFGRGSYITTIAVRMSATSGFKIEHSDKTIVKNVEYIHVYSRNLMIRPAYEEAEYDSHYSQIIKPYADGKYKLCNLLKEAEVVAEFDKYHISATANNLTKLYKVSDDFKDYVKKNMNFIGRVHTAPAGAEKEREFLLTELSDNYDVIEREYSGGKYYIKKTNTGFNQFIPIRLKFNMVDSIDGYSMKLSNILGDWWDGFYLDMGNVDNEGGVYFKNSKKPERLLFRIFNMFTEPNDYVLDSFLGSGTTAAVAHKMGRRWIGIELGDHAYSLCKPRMDSIIDGKDKNGISSFVNWQGGGGYHFYELAPSLLVKNSKLPIYQINPSYTFEMLCEAICKIEGFRYKSEDVFHGHSSEKRFIHITTEFINAGYIKSLSAHLAEGQSLLIYGTKIQSDMVLPDNIEVKKIPKDLLEKCDFESEVQ